MATSHIQPIDSFFSNQDAETGATPEPPSIRIVPLVPSGGSAVPSKRGGATLTQTGNGTVYLIGGADREATSFADVHVFDLETKRWQLLAPSRGSLPARSGHSAVALGNKLVVFGGLNARDGLIYNDVHVFDADTQTWTQVDAEGDAPTPRNAHVALLLPPTASGDGGHRQQAMIVFGGSSPHHGAFDDAFLLHLGDRDAAGGSSVRPKVRWEKLSCSGEQPEARELHCGVLVSESSVCFLGGRNLHGVMCSDMAYLDTKTWAWQVIPMCGWGRCSLAAGLVDGVLTSFGGFDGTSVCGDCWQFCDQVDEWRPAVSTTDRKGSSSVPERFGHCGIIIAVPASVLEGGTYDVSRRGKTEHSNKGGNNTDLRTEHALLIFGGMNAESDLNDLVVVAAQR